MESEVILKFSISGADAKIGLKQLPHNTSYTTTVQPFKTF